MASNNNNNQDANMEKSAGSKVILSNYGAMNDDSKKDFFIQVSSTDILSTHKSFLGEICLKQQVQLKLSADESALSKPIQIHSLELTLTRELGIDLHDFIVKEIQGRYAILLSYAETLTRKLVNQPINLVSNTEMIILKYPHFNMCDTCHLPVRSHASGSCESRCSRYCSSEHTANGCEITRCIRCFSFKGNAMFRRFSTHLASDPLCNVNLNNLRFNPGLLYEL